MISQALLEKFEKQVLAPYHDMDYGAFEKEVDFIRQTAIELAGVQVQLGNESIHVDSVVTHGTPTARFRAGTSDSGPERVACEIADLLFVFEAIDNGTVDHQRAMLTQAKFEPTNASIADRYWTIDMRQLELLERLPEFTISGTGDYDPFKLEPATKTFTSYGFVSTFQLPFYQSTDRVFSETNLANCDFSQRTSRYRPKDFIGFDSSPSVLKRFLRRSVGEDITEPNTEVRRFIESLYDYTVNDRSYQSLFADGGSPVANYDQIDFAIVKITFECGNSELGEQERRYQLR